MPRNLCGLFAIDARSLAAFRIAAGVVLLADLAVRAEDFTAHYTEQGVLPSAALSGTLGSASWRWSLYTLNTADWWPALLMALTAGFAAMLVLGLATRAATAATWVLVLSLHNRMPVIINAGDTLMHVLLFWGIFLPLGAKWSVDALLVRSQGGGRPATVCNPASATILLQMALLYVCAGIFKVTNADWLAGQSMYYVMSFDFYARPAAAWLLQFPVLLQLLTWGTVVLELVGPIVAFSPWLTAPLRILVVAAFALFHLGIEATMTVGFFSWVSLAGWLLFLPSEFWDRWRFNARVTSTSVPASDPLSQRVGGAAAEQPGRLSKGLRWISGGLVLGLLAITVFWNATGFRPDDASWRPSWTRAILELTGLKQQWRMFTRPPKRDGWPRVVANLSDGSQWDLLEDRPGFDWARRELPSAMASNHRWRKYYHNLLHKRNDHLRPYFCRFLAEEAEKRHALEVRSVVLYQVQEITGKPGEEDRIVRKLLHRESIQSEGAFLDAVDAHQGGATEIHPGI